ncbi:hypothetical protein B0181_01510 [Moraxella caviae]|uniref:EcoKI restriction-modification system protein HsdS n=1 Tax=Moraxella caviae TaxID=34060 RepID=A0A1T0AAS2_9GAMM|nr:restriction endonuclease subunit S [Moraxella caviae]OOR92834.1 hypothetical protein B0181_01510 [Moraxella caviae]STZ14123.1 EcoKI restriction-modification system protein HsdS [Moraxella caviae]
MKLKDIVNIRGGKRLPKGATLQIEKNKHPYIRVRDMKDKYVSLDELEYVPENAFPQIKNYIVNENDVIISIVGTIGLVCIIDKALNNASQTENCAKLSGLNKTDAQYLYYFLKSDAGQSEIRKATVGAVQPKLPLYGIENITIDWKSEIEREKIVYILSKLDDKIQLNTQINQTLEQIAQAVFKSWFVDFDPVKAKAEVLANGGTLDEANAAAVAVISGQGMDGLSMLSKDTLTQIAHAMPCEMGDDGVPVGWENVELDTQFKFIGGSQPPKSEHIYEYREGYVRFIQNRDYAKETHQTFIPVSQRNKCCNKKDILIDKYGEAGKVRFGIAGAYNVALAKLEPIGQNKREFLRWYFNRAEIKDYLQASSMASTRNSLNSSSFKGMKITIPDDHFLLLFENFASVIIGKILQVKLENTQLKQTRDFLLPKLLSGEVGV